MKAKWTYTRLKKRIKACYFLWLTAYTVFKMDLFKVSAMIALSIKTLGNSVNALKFNNHAMNGNRNRAKVNIIFYSVISILNRLINSWFPIYSYIMSSRYWTHLAWMQSVWFLIQNSIEISTKPPGFRIWPRTASFLLQIEFSLSVVFQSIYIVLLSKAPTTGLLSTKRPINSFLGWPL